MGRDREARDPPAGIAGPLAAHPSIGPQGCPRRTLGRERVAGPLGVLLVRRRERSMERFMEPLGTEWSYPFRRAMRGALARV